MAGVNERQQCPADPAIVRTLVQAPIGVAFAMLDIARIMVAGPRLRRRRRVLAVVGGAALIVLTVATGGTPPTPW
jgi:hypothetical protein